MIANFFKKPFVLYILPGLERLPAVSFYAKTRGWPFIVAWMHQICGILLVLYIWVHLNTLSSLTTPAEYDAKMKLFEGFLFTLLEWLLAVPVILHALNGGRLIVYEIFGGRNDNAMIRWVFGVSVIYILLHGLLMTMGNQSVSPIFFWLVTSIFSVILVFYVATTIWKTGSSAGWKLHRITAAFLLIMIPAHLLFMHLQPGVGHQSDEIIARMQHIFIKLIDLMLVIGVLYHAGYGLMSIAKDYLKAKGLQISITALIFLIMAAFGWMGIRLTILI